MANQLKMADVYAILALRARRWSCRRIGEELGIHRDTVRRYVRLATEAAAGSGDAPGGAEAGRAPSNASTGSADQNQPDPPPGSNGQDPPNPPLGAELLARLPDGWLGQNRPNPPPGSSGPASLCEPFREVIEAGLEQGLSGQRIWQDLRTEHEFSASYDSVKRFVRRLRRDHSLPFRRMECEAGAEAQVDFGTGAPVVTPDGKRRRTHVFRIVLSHSRKAYSEAVFRQTTDGFIRCLENAFWYFGGVPRTLVIDNLKAAVTKADWFDPELNPKIQSFCAHYGTVILPTRPYMPRHKGKVENSVKYVKSNGLKGRTFTGLAEENRFLLEWETSVADTRIHGTTRQQVKKAFEEVERPALLSLPIDRFPFFHEAKRSVHRDGHVEVDKAYYSVPPEFLGREVWVRWDGHTVRIYNLQMQQIVLHVPEPPGGFSTKEAHLAPEKISSVERGATWLLSKVNLIGPHSSRWAEAMLAERGIQGIRVLQGLRSLSFRHSGDRIERACEIAWGHGAFRLRDIRELIKRQGEKQEQFAFIEEHPIIRSLSDYGELVHTAFTKESWS